jgi:MFS family permease
MELWPNKSRAWLAGLIGAAANVGFVIVALVGMFLAQLIGHVEAGLLAIGLSASLVDRLVSNSGWRLLMISGALPALLTFFIRLFVPESQRWLEEQGRGATKDWSTRDLLAVIAGAGAAVGLVSLWAVERPFGLESPMAVRVGGTALGLVIAYLAYTFPVRRFLQRSLLTAAQTPSGAVWTPSRVLGRMIIGATLSGTALLGTWASIQNAAPWAGFLERRGIEQAHPELSENELRERAAQPAAVARARTQIWSGWGAIVGTILAALLGDWLGRRLSYFLLSIASLAAALLFFLGNDAFGPQFLVTVSFWPARRLLPSTAGCPSIFPSCFRLAPAPSARGSPSTSVASWRQSVPCSSDT